MHRKLYILLAIAAVVISCQKVDIDLESSSDSDNIMRFTTSVVESRLGLDSDNLTEFGVSVVNNNNSTYSYSNINVSKNNSEWEAEQTMLWQNDTQEVSITAHAPYNASFDNSFTVATDQNIEDSYVSSDYLFAHSTVCPSVTDSSNDIYYSEDGTINVDLSHIMAKVTINFTFSANFYGITANPITSVRIGDIYLDGTMDNDTYQISVGEKTGVITPYYNDDFSVTDASVSYQAILIPQVIKASDSFSIVIEAAGKSFTWVSDSDFELLSGRNHILPLKVGEDEEMIFMRDDVTVQEWSNSKIAVNDGDVGSLKSIAVGDLYPNSINPIGVVYSVNDDGISGMVVSLDDKMCAWSTLGDAMGASDETNGLSNMRTILSGDSDFSSHPACAWVDSKNSDTNGYADNSKGVWYLPSREELAELHTAFVTSDVIEDAISTAKGTAFSAAYYWSSTEYSELNSVWVQIFIGTMEFESLDKENDQNYARAILAF